MQCPRRATVRFFRAVRELLTHALSINTSVAEADKTQQMTTINDVFAEVRVWAGEFNGVVPVENSTVRGGLIKPKDCFIDTPFAQSLLGGRGFLSLRTSCCKRAGDPSQITRIVFPHRQSLAQCRRMVVRALALIPHRRSFQ